MNIKLISIAVASLCVSQSVFAQTKTLDFYSTSGSNRYSISGKIKELNLPVDKNSVLITNANSNAYVKLNNKAPFLARFIESDLNLYQMLEASKGQLVDYNGGEIKIVGASNDKLIAEDGDKIVFVNLSDVSFPKSFLNDAQKGLKVTFNNDLKPDDMLYFSQPERELSYANSYEAVLKDNKVNVAHYLNVNNRSLKTFDDVYLNFFLSETNIREYARAMPMVASVMMESSAVRKDMAKMTREEAPTFEGSEIQDLKSIKIQKPMTIYPNLNKIKYTDKDYSIEQYAKVHIDTKYEIYLNDVIDINTKNVSDLKTKGTFLNNTLNERIEELKRNIVENHNEWRNIIEVKVTKGDILPAGKFDLYETVNGQDKLIVSTNISYTENDVIELFKNKNSDLKIHNVQLEEVKDEKSTRDWDKNRRLNYVLKSIEVENVGTKSYVLNIFDKKINIAPKQKLKITP